MRRSHSLLIRLRLSLLVIVVTWLVDLAYKVLTKRQRRHMNSSQLSTGEEVFFL